MNGSASRADHLSLLVIRSSSLGLRLLILFQETALGPFSKALGVWLSTHPFRLIDSWSLSKPRPCWVEVRLEQTRLVAEGSEVLKVR